MKSIRTLGTLTTVFGLLALSRVAQAQLPPPPDKPAPGTPVTICGTTFPDQNALNKKTADFVRKMKIALSQGDILGMQSTYDGFWGLQNQGFAAQCLPRDSSGAISTDPTTWTDFRRICGFECHIQLAKYHLFRAGNIEYYLAYDPVTNPNPIQKLLDAATMAGEVNLGSEIIASGLQLIGETVQPGSGGLQGYLSTKGALNLLQAQLYMAQGDAYYKNISDARLERLAFLVNDAIDADPVAGATNTSLAAAGYDAALWGLNEALLEIPDDAFFNPLYLQAQTLLRQLQERRTSLQQGLLYIGINPDEYKIVNIKDQKDRLASIRDQVLNVESNVESLIKAGVAAGSQTDQSAAANEVAVANQSLSLDAYRLAAIQGAATQTIGNLQAAANVVQNTQNLYSQQLSAAQARFQLQQQVFQTNNQLTQLAGTRELDVLNYQQQNLQAQQNQLQVHMSADVQNTNLTVQIDALGSQKYTLQDNANKDLLTLGQLTDRIGVATNQWKQAQNNIDADRNNISSRLQTMGVLYDATLQGAAQAICADEAQIQYLSGTAVPNPFTWQYDTVSLAPNGSVVVTKSSPQSCPSAAAPVDLNYPSKAAYLQARCDLQTKAADVKISSAADMMLCVVGVANLPQSVQDSLSHYLGTLNPPKSVAGYDCSAINTACQNETDGIACATYTKNAQTIYAARRKQAQDNVKALQNQLIALQDFRDWAKLQLNVQAEAKALDLATFTAKAAAVDSAESSAAAVPLVIAGTAGPFPIAATGIAVFQAAQAADDTAKDIAEAANKALSIADFVLGSKAKVDELDMQIQKLSDSLHSASITSDLENYASAQAVMQITGQALDISSNLQQAIAQQGLNTIDCTSGKQDISAQVTQLQFHHDGLVAQTKAAGLQNDQVAAAIDNLNLDIANQQLAQSNAELTIADLTTEQQKTQADYDTITGPNGLIVRIDQQVSELTKLQGRLLGYASLGDALQASMQVIRDQNFQTQISMNDDQRKYLQSYLSSTVDQTTLVDGAEKSIQGTIIDQGNIVAQIDGVKTKLNAAMSTLQSQMATSAEQLQTVVEQNKATQIYLSNEEMVADMTRGIPQFLDQKRVLLERANYELTLLYNKVNALRATTQAAVHPGLAGTGSDPTPFIRTGQDLATVLQNFDNSLFDQQAIIQAQSVTITIPNTSGLARKLSADREAEFVISPIAANNQSANYGYFALWHDAFDQAQAYTILDMGLKVDFDPSGCQRQHFNLYKESDGYKFFAPGGGAIEPLLAVGTERMAQPLYFTSENVTGDNMNDFFTPWTNQISLFGFWMGEVPIPYDPSLTLPLLGAPVVGSYRITMDPAVTAAGTAGGNNCTYDNAGYRLMIVYAKNNQ